MKVKFFFSVILSVVFQSTANAQDIISNMGSPSYGIMLKANFTSYNGGWSRGFRIANEDGSKYFFGLGAQGDAANGVSTYNYGWIGKKYNNASLYFLANGNVGVKYSTPRSRLDIGKSLGANNGLRIGDYIEINERETINNSAIIGFNAIIDESDVSKFKPVWSASSSASGMILTMESGGVSNLDFYGRTWGTSDLAYGLSNFNHVMRLNVNGNVGIGTKNTYGYKLAVKGSMAASEIKVLDVSSWTDFVFEDNYQLRSLSEVKEFIEENKHLPDIPSEKQVQEEGISVGEMNAKLLQKIEELTLYLIDQNKKIEDLQKEVLLLKSSKP
nr:hypothetical protein [uncultured Marinifilum sp.]